jgi:hypothetical protein
VAIALQDRERGELRIAFYSADDLERLLERFGAASDD